MKTVFEPIVIIESAEPVTTAQLLALFNSKFKVLPMYSSSRAVIHLDLTRDHSLHRQRLIEKYNRQIVAFLACSMVGFFSVLLLWSILG